MEGITFNQWPLIQFECAVFDTLVEPLQWLEPLEGVNGFRYRLAPVKHESLLTVLECHPVEHQRALIVRLHGHIHRTLLHLPANVAHGCITLDSIGVIKTENGEYVARLHNFQYARRCEGTQHRARELDECRALFSSLLSQVTCNTPKRSRVTIRKASPIDDNFDTSFSECFAGTSSKFLGKGTFGEVMQYDTDKAVKRIKRYKCYPSEYVVPIALRGPHIVPILRVGMDAEYVYIVMPLLRRLPCNLESRLMAIWTMQSLSKGLARIHENGYIHGDLRPQNILTDGQQVYISDFGTARRCNPSVCDRNTCTLAYAPPEGYLSTVKNKDGVFTRAFDIWSMGVIFAEIIAGGAELLLPNGTPPEWQSQEGQANYIEQYLKRNPVISFREEDHVDFLCWMMRLRPDERPSAEDLIRTLSVYD